MSILDYRDADGFECQYKDAVFVSREKYDALAARLAEEIENAATYKQERDEIYVNYETVAAKLSEAHRQNADLMAIIDKRDEALGFIPLDKGMDMMDELREAKARLAAAEKAIAAVDELIANSRGVDGLHLNGDIASWDELLAGGQFEEWLGDFSAFLRPADSAPAQESDSHG